jgi:hypothetical protein
MIFMICDCTFPPSIPSWNPLGKIQDEIRPINLQNSARNSWALWEKSHAIRVWNHWSYWKRKVRGRWPWGIRRMLGNSGFVPRQKAESDFCSVILGVISVNHSLASDMRNASVTDRNSDFINKIMRTVLLSFGYPVDKMEIAHVPDDHQHCFVTIDPSPCLGSASSGGIYCSESPSQSNHCLSRVTTYCRPLRLLNAEIPIFLLPFAFVSLFQTRAESGDPFEMLQFPSHALRQMSIHVRCRHHHLPRNLAD